MNDEGNVTSPRAEARPTNAMTHINIDDFGMDTISLAGSLPAKLAAVRDAGFSQIMLSARDVVGHEGGVEAAARGCAKRAERHGRQVCATRRPVGPSTSTRSHR